MQRPTLSDVALTAAGLLLGGGAALGVGAWLFLRYSERVLTTTAR